MELLWKIESVYIGHEINKNYEYNTICNPRDLSNKRYMAELSRYPIMYRNITQPYVINFDVYLNLINKIKVDQLVSDITLDLVSQSQNMIDKKVFYAYSKDTYYVHTPTKIQDLLFSDCYTPLGLLALRLRRHYGNRDFRTKIENDLLNVNFNRVDDSIYVIKREYLPESLEYCDLLSMTDSLPNYPKHVQEELYLANPYVFKWRD